MDEFEFFEIRFDLGKLDSGERSLPFELLVSVAEQAGLCLTWSKIPEDKFSRDVAHLIAGCSHIVGPESIPILWDQKV